MTTFFLSLIYLTFPLILYFLYLVCTKVFSSEENNIFLDLAIISSFYLCIRYSNLNNYILYILNVPIMISYYKDRKFVTIILSIIISYYIYEYKDIPIIIPILEYGIISIVSHIIKKNYIFIFIIVKTIFYFIYVFLNYEVLNVYYLFLIIPISYLLFFGIYNIYCKIETIVKMHKEYNKIYKEKQFYDSLFKITHEIKNPLAVCKGYIDMFDANNISKSNRYIGIIGQEINRTLTLLQDFSRLSKLKLEKETIDVEMLLDDVVDETKLIIKDKITLKTNFVKKEVYINGDYNRLKQVLINAIKNSIEAINGDGKIIIESKYNRKWYKIVIEDNGSGMSNDTINKIGEPFYTTKKNGTGLGVCLSKEIIERHEGTMEYSSIENKGTTLVIKLPIEKNI